MIYNAGLLLLVCGDAVLAAAWCAGRLLLIGGVLLYLAGFHFFMAATRAETLVVSPEDSPKADFPQRDMFLFCLRFYGCCSPWRWCWCSKQLFLMSGADAGTILLYLQLADADDGVAACTGGRVCDAAADGRGPADDAGDAAGGAGDAATVYGHLCTTLWLGVTWHVVFTLLTLVIGNESGWPFRWLGVGSCLELAAVVLFGLSMFRTVLNGGRGMDSGRFTI